MVFLMLPLQWTPKRIVHERVHVTPPGGLVEALHFLCLGDDILDSVALREATVDVGHVVGTREVEDTPTGVRSPVPRCCIHWS